MKITKLLTTILLSLTLVLTACSPEMSATDDGSSSAVNTVVPNDNSTSVDASISEPSWSVTKFLPIEYDFEYMGIDLNNGFLTHQSVTYDSKLYTFFSYQSEISMASAVWLCTYDISTRTIEYMELVVPLEDYRTYDIIRTDMRDAKTISLKLYVTSDTKEAHHIMVEMDTSGYITSIMDPCPLEEVYPWNADYSSNIQVFPGADDTYIIRYWDNATETTTLYQYDLESSSRTSLGQFDREFMNSLYFDGKENIYYISNHTLNQYNTQSRTTESLCNLSHLGIAPDSSIDFTITLTANGQLLLCNTSGIYYLTDEEVLIAEEALIEFANISQFNMDYTKQYAASFSVHSNNCFIQLEQVSDMELADFRDRIIIDMVADKGPELLWVSKEDMLMLAEKGAIMDIRELIPDDIYAQLFPGVIQDCTINGKLVGITPEISFETLIISDKVWDEASWTYKDMLSLLESREWEYPFLYGTWGMSCYSLFYNFFVPDWYNSPFVDMESGISHFNEADFIHAMELCKKYDKQDATLENEDLYTFIDNGESIARQCFLYFGLQNFSNYMDTYQNSGHIIGYPTVNGSNSYLYSDGYLVVNANATHTKEIADFIAYLLDFDNQYNVQFAPVRKDVVENCIVYNEQYEKNVLKCSSTGTIAVIPLKKDGSTYLTEYLAFIESCVPRPTRAADITAILGEEFPAYFKGNKSAADVANIIHNRVQLYFDENK